MAPIHQNCLKEQDLSVLSAIFNPFEPGTDLYNAFEEEDSTVPQDSNAKPQSEQSTETTKSIEIETEAIKAAEKKEFERALDLFQDAINFTPQRAEPYNNRAQAYRLLGNNEAAIADLNKAIELSHSKGSTACKAFCQRGLLRRKNDDIDGAKEDFTNAAKLGSKFARSQLVELNPYAALCNQMLRDVFQKLK